MRIVRYAACAGITMCARTWQVNARETRSRCVATNDAIKSRNTMGSCKSGGDLKATCFTTREGDETRSGWLQHVRRGVKTLESWENWTYTPCVRQIPHSSLLAGLKHRRAIL